MLTATMANPLSRYRLWRASMEGISQVHVGHQVAQMFRKTMRPRKSSRETVRPLKSENLNAGALSPARRGCALGAGGAETRPIQA